MIYLYDIYMIYTFLYLYTHINIS